MAKLVTFNMGYALLMLEMQLNITWFNQPFLIWLYEILKLSVNNNALLVEFSIYQVMSAQAWSEMNLCGKFYNRVASSVWA